MFIKDSYWNLFVEQASVSLFPYIFIWLLCFTGKCDKLQPLNQSAHSFPPCMAPCAFYFLSRDRKTPPHIPIHYLQGKCFEFLLVKMVKYSIKQANVVCVFPKKKKERGFHC